MEILQPGESEHEWSEEERAVQVRPDGDDHGRQPQPSRMLLPIHYEQQQSDEAEHPEELRAERQRRCRDHEGEQRQDGRRSGIQPAADGDQSGSAEDHTDDQGADDGEPDPTTDGLDEPKQDLRAPLLVEPGLAGHREGPGVDDRDAAARQDLRPST